MDFLNDKGRPTILYGVVVAAGCGSSSDPLSKYDLVFLIVLNTIS